MTENVIKRFELNLKTVQLSTRCLIWFKYCRLIQVGTAHSESFKFIIVMGRDQSINLDHGIVMMDLSCAMVVCVFVCFL